MQSMFSAQRSATASGRKVGAPQSSTSKGRPILIGDLAAFPASPRCELENPPLASHNPKPKSIIQVRTMKHRKAKQH